MIRYFGGFFYDPHTLLIYLSTGWVINPFVYFICLAIPAHLSFSRPLLTEALFWGLYIFSQLNSNILFKEEILPRYRGGGLTLHNSRQFSGYSLSYFCIRHLAASSETKPRDEPHVEMLCLQSGVFTQPKFERYASASSHFRSHRRVFGLHSRSAGKQFASTNRASYLFTVGTGVDW